jgi:hypothetical protein
MIEGIHPEDTVCMVFRILFAKFVAGKTGGTIGGRIEPDRDGTMNHAPFI